MKTNISILAILFTTIATGISQTPEEIMKIAMESCKRVTHGYYEMTSQFKSMTNADTSHQSLRTWFKKLPKDDCFGYSFHTNYMQDGIYQGYRLYTGTELISASDTAGTVTSVSQWKQHIKNISHNYDSYQPFTNTTRSLPSQKELRKKDIVLSHQPNATLLGRSCHHIVAQEKIENDPAEPMQVLGASTSYWIDHQTHLVLQYETTFTLYMNGDTMIQFERVTLDTFNINDPIHETKLSRSSIPASVILSDYTPHKEVPLLSNNTLAPNWSLVSLTNDSVKLESLRGKLVLIDFWYKSCYPCMQALPALQSLHDKYKDQGLMVVGINPYDTPEDDLVTFLGKRNVNYTCLYADRTIPKAYSVTAYPTLYLIGQDGQILYGQKGFSTATEARLEKIIVENL